MAGIEVKSVSQSFGPPDKPIIALREATFSIEKGELMCLIGPSGCGKSTLLNIMAGLARASAGEVLIDGAPVRGPIPKKMAFVFQENTLVPWRTALDNIRLGLSFQGAPKAERDERARAALDLVGMTDFAGHFPRQLSGGMKQRIQLARALALDTDIILMDEPFAALDEQTRMVLGEELSVLLARGRKTIVFVTHSLTEAVFLADRVAVFSARPGYIKAIIPIEESHPRPRSFMTSPKLTGLRNQLYEMLHDEVLATMRASLGMPADAH